MRKSRQKVLNIPHKAELISVVKQLFKSLLTLLTIDGNLLILPFLFNF